jgi:hypothetical protein
MANAPKASAVPKSLLATCLFLPVVDGSSLFPRQTWVKSHGSNLRHQNPGEPHYTTPVGDCQSLRCEELITAVDRKLVGEIAPKNAARRIYRYSSMLQLRNSNRGDYTG